MTYGTSQPTEPLEFLDLPPEVRMIIYDMLFKDLTIYWKQLMSDSSRWTLDIYTPGACFMYSCHAIRNDIQAKFYKDTIFSLTQMAKEAKFDATFEFCKRPPVVHSRNLTALEVPLSHLVCDQKIRPWEPQHIGILEGNWKIAKLTRLLDSKSLQKPIFPNLRRVRTVAPRMFGFDNPLLERFFTACVKLSELRQLELLHEYMRPDIRESTKRNLAVEVMAFYPLDGKLELKQRDDDSLLLRLTRIF